MIDKEGNATIMDFGIARSISVKGIPGAGVMIGAPEIEDARKRLVGFPIRRSEAFGDCLKCFLPINNGIQL
jgi:hypothetical protein